MDFLNSFLNNKSKTILCAGPLSTNIIDVATELSNIHSVPIVLVASRRQVDAEELGGGYVNNWSTKELVDYIKLKDAKSVVIERDHGGPGQGQFEIKNQLSVSESMAAAKKSYESDIDAGLHILHIDPTIPILGENLNYQVILNRLFELYGHVIDYARSKQKIIQIEIGTEEQNGSYTDLKSFEDFLNQTKTFCNTQKLQTPKFVVIQTGAKVIEAKNIGLFERGSKYDKTHLINNISESAQIAEKYGIYIKEHNADYLSYESLCLRPSIGIRASNIAPEFGHTESKSFFSYLHHFGQVRDYEGALNLVIESNKWQKWVTPESQLSKFEKACLAGHYCYSLPEFIEIKNKLAHDMLRKNLNLDEFLKQSIRSVFYKYLTAFKLV